MSYIDVFRMQSLVLLSHYVGSLHLLFNSPSNRLNQSGSFITHASGFIRQSANELDDSDSAHRINGQRTQPNMIQSRGFCVLFDTGYDLLPVAVDILWSDIFNVFLQDWFHGLYPIPR